MIFALLACAATITVTSSATFASPSPAAARSCLNSPSFALLELAAAGGAALASPNSAEAEQPTLAWAGPDPRDVPCSGNKPCIFDAAAADPAINTGSHGVGRMSLAAAASPAPQCPPGSIPFRSNVSATAIDGRKETRAVLACYICGKAGAYCDGNDSQAPSSSSNAVSGSGSSGTAAAVAQRACPAGYFCPRTYVAIVSGCEPQALAVQSWGTDFKCPGRSVCAHSPSA